MKNRIVCMLLILLLYHTASAQTSAKDSICWTKAYKLTWADFQGTPPKGNYNYKAACGVSISAQGSSQGGLPDFNIQVCFSKNESWTKDTVSTKLLAHEQLHFDIAELYGRKIRKAIADLKKKKLKNFNDYTPTIQKLLEEREATNVKYDNETKHGTVADKQAGWADKVRKEMEGLSKYASE